MTFGEKHRASVRADAYAARSVPRQRGDADLQAALERVRDEYDRCGEPVPPLTLGTIGAVRAAIAQARGQ